MTLGRLEPEIINPSGRGGIILLCDHASNHVPEGFFNLGLTDDDLTDHIAWDIGMADITRKMCDLMDIPGVLAPVSRLVIDCNREDDSPTLIPKASDGISIPANNDLTSQAVAARKAAYYDPFHEAADKLVQAHLSEGLVPLIVGMHSYTSVMDNEERPWGAGFLWKDDPRLAQAMIGLIERETDLKVGDNEPYSGHTLYHTMQKHGADHGLPQTTLELRQDLVLGRGMIDQWAALIADCLDECLERSDLKEIKHY